VTFDLTPLRLQIDPSEPPPPGPGQTGDLPELYFNLTTDQQSAGTYVEWRYDAVSSTTVAGVGTFVEKSWSRSNPSDEASVWTPTTGAHAMTFRLKVLQYAATSQEVYAITLGALPDAASTGRIAFNRALPAGTAAALELSTAGTGGPWTAVSNGDVVALAQLLYHLRLTMTPSADQRRAPAVSALGVEFRSRVDLSAESTVTHMSQEVSVPFLQASVGEGSVAVVRTGRRDYHDPAADLAVAGPDTTLEADVYLGSRHPAIGRADWFHLARATVSNRHPTDTDETFSLLSIAKTLKRKIPERIESISSVHTVQATLPAPSTTQFRVSPALVGASPTGNEYDGKGYYIRVRKSAVAGVSTGTVWIISGNTGVDLLDFGGSFALPAALAAGDVIEVHSGTFVQPSLSWVDRDPADIWWDLLTVQRGIPSDRIGRADVGTTGRAGLPPRVTDRAPGDATTQAKLKVSRKITDATEADALIDQVSFLLGGATIEIAGQFVFRQIYPLRDASGRITVPLDPPVVVFDPRDHFGLDTPTGREHRTTVLAGDYGVNSITGADAATASTVVYTDVDALAALGTQDVEGLGTATIPDEIAAWCFNSADGGLLLMSMLTQQVVYATSTGVRLWPFASAEARPELTVGDTVIVVTDRYTDYDPALALPIRGWFAYPLTLVGTSNGGRQFKGFLQGLSDVTAVRLRGGAGLLDATDPNSSRAKLNDVRHSEEGETDTVYFTPGANVSEVWAAAMVFTAPAQATDWQAVAAAVVPLPAGATSLVVPHPGDTEVTLVQLEARLSDLVVSDVVRHPITGLPQVPHAELDDSETPTVATQWWKITERGIPVSLVEVQTQVGTIFSAWGPPTRGAGAASTVRGGVLGAGEYEHDVVRDATRQSWIIPRLTLANGAPPIVLGPFDFDRNTLPDLVTVTVAGTSVTILADSGDTKAVGLYRAAPSTWKYEVNGSSATINVAGVGTNGVAGLGSGTADTFTAKALSDPVVEIGVGTLSAVQDVVVSNGASTPAAVWDTVQADAPALFGNTIPIRLKATAAPAGWTAKVWVNDPSTATLTDVSAFLSPALSAPPTSLTTYNYTASASRVNNGPHAALQAVTVRAYLYDNLGVIQSTRYVSVTYYVPSTI
jgi:hypothetical protein